VRNTQPIIKDLVLLGGGHSHVIVLRKFGMRPMPGVRITLVTRDLHAPYSGMLPGVIAGHYSFDDAHIDLAPLCRFAGARLYHTEAVGLDLSKKAVVCRGRPPVPYDLLSIDIGIAPNCSVIGASEHAVPVKPIAGLVSRWKALEKRIRESADPLRIAVVGAGAAGVELTLSMHRAVMKTGTTSSQPEFHLFGASPTVLPTHSRGAQRRFTRVLNERGVYLHLGQRVSQVSTERIELDDGTNYPVDEIVWATDAAPQRWVEGSGLAVDDHGFLIVQPTLQSISHADVFAAGDVASVVGYPREKAGVFAVRQGPPLAQNLRRVLAGKSPRPFAPQRHFLSLVSTGDQYAVASRGRLSFEGSWVWRWKDWIDRRFMSRFVDFPVMETTDPETPGVASSEDIRELTSAAMRCGGCGSKVGASMLDRVIRRLEPIHRDEVLVGLNAPDDASVESIPEGKLVVQSVDAFRSMVDDSYLFGCITANHCLSDLYAMGAEPQSALAIASIPFGLEHKMETQLEEILAGGISVLNHAGAALVGGHTNEGSELTLGFAVTGTINRGDYLTKQGLTPGDALILTKPLGTGTLLVADMHGKAKARWVDGAIRSMLVSNRDSASLLRSNGATACTDVTGFGLLGHLVEMTKASGVDVSLDLNMIPWLDGACETAAAGLLSSLQPQNLRLRRALVLDKLDTMDPRYSLLFDPQTAGGLLASVSSDRAGTCVAQLRAAGYRNAAVIGVVRPLSNLEQPITVTG